MLAVFLFFPSRTESTHLRETLQHQQNPQTLHVNTPVKQLHGFVQVVLSGQRNHQLAEGDREREREWKPFSDLDGSEDFPVLRRFLPHCWCSEGPSSGRRPPWLWPSGRPA